MACDTIRINLQGYLAEQFLSLMDEESGQNLFLFVSRVLPWGSDDAYPKGTPSNDDVPPSNPDTVQSEIDSWRQMLGLKRILRQNVSLVVPRINWTTGMIWQPYRANIVLFQPPDPNPNNLPVHPFYCLVDDTRVYKCIDNNDGVPSTVKPLTRGTEIETTTDGYRWKFLYEIPESRLSFLTDDMMPVEHIIEFDPTSQDTRALQWAVQGAAVPGAIDHVYLEQSGLAFPAVESDAANNTINSNQVVGDSQVRLNSNASSTDGHYNGYAIVIAPGTPGEGQVRVITSYSGATKIATINRPWDSDIQSGVSKYLIVPRVVISGDGTDAEGVAFCDISGIVRRIDVTNVGRDYTYAQVQILPAIHAPEDMPLPKAVVSPDGGHGSNPVRELGARQVMIVMQLSQDESGSLSVANDFRQFGIVVNPIIRGGVNDGIVAGTEIESMRLVEIQRIPPTVFWQDNPDPVTFPIDDIVIGQSTHANGQVYRWAVEPQEAFQTRGTLLLRKLNGEFTAPRITTNQTLTLGRPNRLELTIADAYVAGNDFVPGDTVYQGSLSGTFPGDETATGIVETWEPATIGNPGSRLVLTDLEGDAWVVDGSQHLVPAGNPPAFGYHAVNADNRKCTLIRFSTPYASGRDFPIGQFVYQGPPAGPFPGTSQSAYATVQAWIPAPIGQPGSVLIVEQVVPDQTVTPFVDDGSEVIALGGNPPAWYYIADRIEVYDRLTFLSGKKAIHSDATGDLQLILTTPYVSGQDFTIGETVYQGSDISGPYPGVETATGEVVSWTPAQPGQSGSVLVLTNVVGSFVDDASESVFPAGAPADFGYNVGNVTERLTRYTSGITTVWSPSSPGTAGSRLTLRNISGQPFSILDPNRIMRDNDNTRQYMIESVDFAQEFGGESLGVLSPGWTNPRLSLAQVLNIERIYVDRATVDNAVPPLTLDQIRSSLFAPTNVYSTTYDIDVQWDGITPFDDDTFPVDAVLVGNRSLSTGIIVEWRPVRTGNYAYKRGTLRLVDVSQDYLTIDPLDNPPTLGERLNILADDILTRTGVRILTVRRPEIYHRSGRIIYVQNIKPVQRDFEQREEFKITFGF